MALTSQILMIDSEDGSSEALEDRIAELGVQSVRVDSFDEALQMLADRSPIISAVCIPTNLPDGMTTKDLKRAIKELRRVRPANDLMLISAGKEPARDERKRLRSAGLQLALWEPFDEGTLRFQLNRAMSGDADYEHRRAPRVPTYLFARIYIGDRTKDSIIYSLSETGAFLETPRASVDGAAFDVEIRLPGQPIMVKSTVMFSNVPGNLQRPNLSMGMGIQFERLSRNEKKALRGYIDSCLDRLDV
jgi:DNA-binding response OmpR family regulator